MLARELNHEPLPLRQDGFPNNLEFAKSSKDADNIEFCVEFLLCFGEEEVLFEFLSSPVVRQGSDAKAPK